MARHSENSPNSGGPQGPSSERGVWDEALEPEQIRALNNTLRKVPDMPGASPELKEMAKKLLSGQVSLRDIVDDPSGSSALGSGLASLRGQWESASDEERDRIRNIEDEAEAGRDDSGRASSSSGDADSRRAADDEQRPKKQGRHSGGFSLY
ncbi:hypothetical protein ACFQVC_31205 [Streptomyces monticola]|uniref:Uncharacterized protein n=1 Tax=Streptomyces monticola TaxID=2666263 RepID=A0ABW2JSC5_9ACTN